ncbi:MAG: hypothetical protein H6622_11290 [Halobacteriovoraceae bacterium]|nr:hypothetical protein [Halobacteriovoraceae bacterium]
MSTHIGKRNCTTFGDHFKKYMRETGLPVPQTVFNTAASTLATVGAISHNMDRYPNMTLSYVVGTISPGMLSVPAAVELTKVAGGILASFYLGVCIGSSLQSLIDMGACKYNEVNEQNYWRFYGEIVEKPSRPHWLQVQIATNKDKLFPKCEKLFLKKY